VAAGRDEQVLAAGGGDEPLQAVVVRVDVGVGDLQVLGGGVGPHPGEEVGGRHVDHELQLELLAARRDVGAA
jgi:hypothetical protein